MHPPAVLQVTFNQFFLGYVVLFEHSMSTLIGGVSETDPAAVEARVSGDLSERVPSVSGTSEEKLIGEPTK